MCNIQSTCTKLKIRFQFFFASYTLTVTSSSGSLPSHAQLATFELTLAKLWNRESGQIDHVGDVESKGNLIEHGQVAM